MILTHLLMFRFLAGAGGTPVGGGTADYIIFLRRRRR